ncbi:hypothetical protein [Holospora curviuscula]|uniref:Uncharacterized protein n=1 Tax=Holospora curviuscula TaxID=1082868 RepID=A0A2S5R970_9PROT|nr:hypothetical protein [Holospora curviuscula]PPE03871.1 hypothetical protein HCUR_00649 [Holospora curviuscula]
MTAVISKKKKDKHIDKQKNYVEHFFNAINLFRSMAMRDGLMETILVASILIEVKRIARIRQCRHVFKKFLCEKDNLRLI